MEHWSSYISLWTVPREPTLNATPERAVSQRYVLCKLRLYFHVVFSFMLNFLIGSKLREKLVAAYLIAAPIHYEELGDFEVQNALHAQPYAGNTQASSAFVVVWLIFVI